MTLAIGVDLIEVARIEGVLARHGDRFLSRIFTDGERAYCAGRAQALAARFAAKEAVGKALGTGIGPIAWREVEVVKADGGAPSLVFHGEARRLIEARGLGQPALSLAHTHQHAIAFVVWECHR